MMFFLNRKKSYFFHLNHFFNQSIERDEPLEYANKKVPHVFVSTVMKFHGHAKPFLEFQWDQSYLINVCSWVVAVRQTVDCKVSQ